MNRESLDAFAAVLLPWMVEIQARSFVLLVLTGLILLLQRRSSAALRHLVLSLTVFCLFSLPMFSLLLPPWSVPVPQPVSSLPELPRRAMGTVAPRTSHAAPHSAAPGLSKREATPAAAGSAIPVMPTVQSLPNVNEKPVDPRSPLTLPMVPILVSLLWGSGATVLALRLGLGLIRLRRLAQQAHPAPAVASLVKELSLALGLRTTVRLLIGSPEQAPHSPMTWGFFRPVVLLPAAAADWPGDQLRSVLLHELAHVRRGDWGAELLVQVVCAFYWPNPGVWILARRQRQESEYACDDRVLLSGIAPANYAQHLLAVVRLLKSQREHRLISTTAILMAARSGVEGRVRAILSPLPSRRPASVRAVALALAVAVVLLLPLASLRRATAGDTRAGGLVAAATVSTAENKPITLPGGIRVEFLPVRGNLADGTPASWQPDGTYPTQITKSVYAGAYALPPYAKDERVFAARISYPTEALQRKAFVAFGVKKAPSRDPADAFPSWANCRTCTLAHKPGTVDWISVYSTEQPFPAGQKQVTMVLQLAAGPRTTIIAGSPTHETTRRLPMGGTARLSAAYRLPELQPAGGKQVRLMVVKVTIPIRFGGDDSDYDLVPIGRDGKPLARSHWGSDFPEIKNQEATLRFSFRTDEVPLAKVKEFRFVERPIHRLEFPGIQLQPTGETSDKPSGNDSLKIGTTTFYNNTLPTARSLSNLAAKQKGRPAMEAVRTFAGLRFAPGSDRFPNGVVAEGLSVTGIGSDGTVSSWDRNGNLLAHGPNWRSSRLKPGELSFRWDRLKLPDMPSWIDKGTYEYLTRTRGFESESGIVGSPSTGFGRPRSRIIYGNGYSNFIESYTGKRPADAATVDLFLTTSYGSWQTLAVSSRSLATASPLPNGSAALSPLTTRRGGVEAEVVARVPPRFLSKAPDGRPLWSLRLEPVDAAGQMVGSPRIAQYDETPKRASSAQLRFRFLTSELPFAKVASVRLLARPVQTLYFRNIATRPKALPVGKG